MRTVIEAERAVTDATNAVTVSSNIVSKLEADAVAARKQAADAKHNWSGNEHDWAPVEQARITRDQCEARLEKARAQHVIALADQASAETNLRLVNDAKKAADTTEIERQKELKIAELGAAMKLAAQCWKQVKELSRVDFLRDRMQTLTAVQKAVNDRALLDDLVWLLK